MAESQEIESVYRSAEAICTQCLQRRKSSKLKKANSKEITTCRDTMRQTQASELNHHLTQEEQNNLELLISVFPFQLLLLSYYLPRKQLNGCQNRHRYLTMAGWKQILYVHVILCNYYTLYWLCTLYLGCCVGHCIQ